MTYLNDRTLSTSFLDKHFECQGQNSEQIVFDPRCRFYLNIAICFGKPIRNEALWRITTSLLKTPDFSCSRDN